VTGTREASTAGTAATVSVDLFEDFFVEVHRRPPFPWQVQLAEEVLTTGRWPEVLDVPTGLGKTSVLDIAVVAAAAGPGGPGRRRLFFVVDRRVVVDQTWKHANRLAEALRDQAGPASRRVASGLTSWCAPDPAALQPLRVTRMRGGVTWDWRWASRPDQPTIVVGTVDQIGSRVLFRGYGLGDRLRPLDAAMVGTDSLIVVDEAHLAVPLVATVRDAARRDAVRGNTGASVVAPGPIVVTSSATPGLLPGRAFVLDPAAHTSDAEATRRLHAGKRLSLAVTAGGYGDVPATLAAFARRHASSAQVVGVIANTVGLARAVHDLLDAAAPGRAVLLTGRSRPFDRDAILDAWLPRMTAERRGATPVGDEEPLYVVATQTLEVGADVDLDALVTTNTSWDSLTQRLGRVNRRGTLDDAPVTVVRAGRKAAPHDEPEPDPVYGAAATVTWQFLAAHTEPVLLTSATADTAALPPGLPVSPTAVTALAGDVPSEALAPRPRTPLLLEPFLDLWACTGPTPDPDPPVEPFIRGVNEPRGTVSLLWRADITPAHLDPYQTYAPTTGDAADRVEHVLALLAAAPPTAAEQLDLPLPAARAWLTGAAPAQSDATDHEALPLPTGTGTGTGTGGTTTVGRRALRLRGHGAGEIVEASAVCPGDVLVLPADYGGLDAYGWNPASTTAVRDVGDLTTRESRRKRLRLDARVWAGSVSPEALRGAARLLDQARGEAAAAPDDAALRAAAVKALPGLRAAIADDPIAERSGLVGLLDEAARVGVGVISVASQLVLQWGPAAVPEGDDTTPTGSVAGRAPVSLAAHQAAVARRARAFADALHLPPPLADAVEFAAAAHDEGKRDPRFQAMLHGGDRVLAELADEPLAKSGLDPTDRDAFRRATERSGYPRGARHELLSQRLAAEAVTAAGSPAAPGSRLADALRGGLDEQLLLHLIGSHHGWARPLHPPTADPAAGAVRARVLGVDVEVHPAGAVDWTTPRRFAELNSRYGRWGLALLESCVRLADIACSEEGT